MAVTDHPIGTAQTRASSSLMLTHQMMHGAVISLPEPFTIVLAKIARDPGMTVLIAVIHVRTAVIVKVLAGAFNAIVKALTLGLAELCRGRIPSPAVLAVAWPPEAHRTRRYRLRSMPLPKITRALKVQTI